MGNAKLNTDGSVTVVIAAKDAGVGNFLDTAGHTSGTILWRWVDAKTHPIPKCRVVKLNELKA
jgi:acylphosphatase